MVMRVWQQSIVFYCTNEQEGTMKSVAISRYNAAQGPTRRTRHINNNGPTTTNNWVEQQEQVLLRTGTL